MAMGTKTKTAGPKRRTGKGKGAVQPTGCVHRANPRAVPGFADCQSKATKVPEHPLDAFLIHPGKSFDPAGARTGDLAISEEQWEAACVCLCKGYALGLYANPEEAVIAVSMLSITVPHRLVFAYRGDDEVLWVKRA